MVWSKASLTIILPVCPTVCASGWSWHHVSSEPSVPLKKGAVFFAPTVAGRAGHVVGATGTNLDANRYQEMRSLAPAYRWAIRIVIVVLVIEAAFVMVIIASPWPFDVTLKHFWAMRNCETARAMGLEPARMGEPGYWPWLDRDKDGIACEP